MKKFKHYTVLGFGICLIILLEILSATIDSTSEVTPRPPPYVYLIPLIAEKQPKLDPIMVNQIAESTYRYSKEFRFPAELIISLMLQESSLLSTRTSKANCIGLMQINPAAHPEKIQDLELNQLYYIDNNIRVGCTILREYYNATGSISEALKKYLGADNKTYLLDILTDFTNTVISKNNSDS